MPKQVTLTDTKIKHAKPREKEYNLAAGKGLYLRVMPSGTKTWLFNYLKPYLGSRSNLSLGRYPEMSLKRALEERDKYRRWLVDGIDPKAQREALSAKVKDDLQNTFAAVFNRWMEVKAPSISPAYAKAIEDTMRRNLLGRLGRVPLSKLTAQMVISTLTPLAQKQALETVRKTCSLVNEVMDYGVNAGFIHHNPLSGIRKAFQAPTTRNRPTIPPAELPQLLADLRDAPVTLETRCALFWMLHTLCRPGEAVAAEWLEIDFGEATWTIPPKRMKMRREHIVPLTDSALKVLTTMSAISAGRVHIFPSIQNPRKHLNITTLNAALTRMGYGGRLVAHGVRALGSTILNEHGHDPELIEVALAHVDKNAVRAAYNRATYLERRRKMMEWWSNHIEEAASGRVRAGKGVGLLRLASSAM